MIFLYIISLLCVLALFVPSMYLPEIVKWPVCLVVILFITFLFNLPKKDTRYITNDTKRKIVNHGLFNPLILYVSASLFVLGFVIIVDYLLANNITDIIGQFNEIMAIFEVSIMNNVLHGLILIVISILIYFLRYSFKNNASNTGLKLRSFWYINLTIIALLIGLFKFLQFSDIVLLDYLVNGYNGYIFLGIVGLVLLIDFIGLLIRVGKAKKALKKQRLAELEQNSVVEVEESVVTPVLEETPVVEEAPVVEDPISTVEEVYDNSNDPWSPENAVMVTTTDKPKKKKTGELSDRQKRKVEKIRAKEEKKLAKEEAKIKRQMEKIMGTIKDDEEIEFVETTVTPSLEPVEEAPVVESESVLEEAPVVVEEPYVPAEAVDVIPSYEGFVDPLGFVSEDDPWAPNRAKMVAPKRK